MAGTLKLRTPALTVLFLALLCACGRDEASTQAFQVPGDDAPSRAREGRLDLLVRAPAPTKGWAGEFEAQSGCKLHLRSVPSAAELLAQAGTSDVDLVLASGDVALNLVAAGVVQRLDPARIPALAGIDARARDHAGAVLSSQRYGVPWLWQPNGLAYDTAAFANGAPGWSELYEPAPPATPSASGRVLAAAAPIAIADAALYLAATRPELRIVDPYALDERQYAAALALLRRQKPLLRGYAGDVAAQADAFRNGVVASAATPAQARALQAQGLPVAWVAPGDSASAQVEIAMLHANARHPNCAYAWLQWSLSPRAQAQLAGAAGALPLVPAACGLEPLATDDACHRDGMALLPRAQLARVPQARCGRGRCVPYSRWTRDYLALVGE